jgi:hypothetical protein
MQQMIEVAMRENASTIGVMEVAADDVGSWGIVETRQTGGRSAPISRIVEKPKAGTTPSTLAVVGRYVLTPRIFHHLRQMPAGAGGEIQLTDGIPRLLDDESVVAYRFEGRRYDCGRKLGYLEATVDFGLKHPEPREVLPLLCANGRHVLMTLERASFMSPLRRKLGITRALQREPAGLFVAIRKLEEAGGQLLARGEQITATPVGTPSAGAKVLEAAGLEIRAGGAEPARRRPAPVIFTVAPYLLPD